ncbi:MAG: ParA family protein [Firmicutes bacterium]|nr:ParA family protein [Bacillota bacterium]
MAQTIAITNQKGGVGKTTTAAALAGGLTELGHRVLAIDVDPQGNLGFSLGVDIENGHTSYDILKSPEYILDAIRHTDYGDVIPSNILLSSAEIELNCSDREYLLKTAVDKVNNMYDFIIIDTPPSLNILTVNAYVCSDSLIIPMTPEILSLLGISQLKETIDTVRKYYNSHLRVLGVLLTKYNKRLNLSREVAEMAAEIAKQLGTVVLDDKIRTSVAVAEAPAHAESLMHYAPNANATHDYMSLIKKISEGVL